MKVFNEIFPKITKVVGKNSLKSHVNLQFSLFSSTITYGTVEDIGA